MAIHPTIQPLPSFTGRPLLLSCLLFLAAASFAQDSIPGVVNVTKINFLNPGISYEHRIGKNQTVQLSAFMNVLVSLGFSSDHSTSDVYVDPAVGAEYRYYYNFRKRSADGKSVSKNSANYIGLYGNMIFSKMRVNSSYYIESKRRNVNVVGLGWGMQRNYTKHFSLDLNIGGQYRFARSSYPGADNTTMQKTGGEFLPAVLLGLGFWLN